MNVDDQKKYRQDRYGRRAGIERRVTVMEGYVPERRSGKDRRSGRDRRARFLGRT